MNDRHERSILKGATWRITGTLDTIFLSFVFTGNISTALKIGAVEFFTKIFLYYLHERLWMRLKFGTKEVFGKGILFRNEKHYRSVIKGASWRVIGSLDTFWIVLFVNHNAVRATQIAFYIAATEVISKIFLFWLHERIWIKINWGKN